MNKGKNNLEFLTQQMSREQKYYLKKFKELLIKQNKKHGKENKSTS